MRRTFAVLALLATSWPHAVVLECALGSTSPSGDQTSQHGATAHPGAEGAGQYGAAHHGASHHGAGHEHRTGDRTASDVGPPGGGLQCAMVMACGLVMMQSEAAAPLAESRSVRNTVFQPSLDAPSAADLATDPPPPRRHA